MFDAAPSHETVPELQTALGDLKAFVGSHRSALLEAAHLLGGRSGLRVGRAAIEILQDSRHP